ncbi:MAG: diguanylate cyclase domain-containing protein, partial [Burkholderiales bacterium]
ACLTRTLRESDFLARIDDAHMAIVIPQVSDRETANRIAEKLARALLPEHASRLALGGALFPADATSRDALIDAATERIRRASAQTNNAGIEV